LLQLLHVHDVAGEESLVAGFALLGGVVFEVGVVLGFLDLFGAVEDVAHVELLL
jgi:hypothetical protein